MHQIRFPLRPRPKSRWGSLQRFPDSAVFEGPFLRRGKGRKGKEKGRERGENGGREERERGPVSNTCDFSAPYTNRVKLYITLLKIFSIYRHVQ